MSNSFCAAVGDWRGTAEVYGGDGRFIGNGVDQRHVATEVGTGRVRIDLSFVGPFKFAGHYVIADHGTHRVYEGPVNVGFAEALGKNLVQADNYWAAIGMSQRFLLMMLPGGDRQLSLALLSRGERLTYAVVGENEKVAACGVSPLIVDGASIDLAQDPSAGRGAVLLHANGVWRGNLACTDGALKATGERPYEEAFEDAGGGVLRLRTTGGQFSPEPVSFELTTDGFSAWTRKGSPVAGSYTLFGGRASSGQLHRLDTKLRVWRREVVSHDGAVKAVVNNWYRGGERVGVEHGILHFEPRSPVGG